MATDEPTSAPHNDSPPAGGDASVDGVDQTGDGDGGAEDTRKKFREALARKQGRAHLGGSVNAATQHPHAAPAKRGRTFRRKSG